MTEMYIIRNAAGRQVALLCGNCGHVTVEAAPFFCPCCGAQVVNVEDDGDGLTRAMIYAHDEGFNEGYQAKELEDTHE